MEDLSDAAQLCLVPEVKFGPAAQGGRSGARLSIPRPNPSRIAFSKEAGSSSVRLLPSSSGFVALPLVPSPAIGSKHYRKSTGKEPRSIPFATSLSHAAGSCWDGAFHLVPDVQLLISQCTSGWHLLCSVLRAQSKTWKSPKLLAARNSPSGLGFKSHHPFALTASGVSRGARGWVGLRTSAGEAL